MQIWPWALFGAEAAKRMMVGQCEGSAKSVLKVGTTSSGYTCIMQSNINASMQSLAS